MAEVVGVKFKEVGKVYYFSPDSKQFNKGDMVIVETSRGVECGEIAMENKEVPESEIMRPLKSIIRLAGEEDIKITKANRKKEKDAFSFCEKKALELGLDMKLVDVECTFDGSKILFYFTSDGRVDFRELVKILASNFKTRIEMRQIGVRDEAKMLGGLGICGRPFCCGQYMADFHPVSIKMAKEQGLSLNPTKISGTCGRLMCCLKYEQDTYEYLYKTTPKVGAIVETREGKGTVVETNILAGTVKVQLERRPEAAPSVYSKKDVKIIKDGKIQVDKSEMDALKGIE